MEIRPKPKIVKAMRVIVDEQDQYHLVPFSFRLDEVTLISRDYRDIPGVKERCLLMMKNEMVTVVVSYDDLHGVWVKALNDQQVVIFTNDN